jgi:hypothetical protein
MYLQKVECRYPEDERQHNSRRSVAAARQEFQVCRAFNLVTPIATPSVVGARNEGTWLDFDHGQCARSRDLASALQIPVYYIDNEGRKVVVGVLSLDSDKPDMFLVEETPLWQDDMVGFLVNIALAERLRLSGRRGETRPPMSAEATCKDEANG